MSYISKYASMFPNYQRLGETLGQIKNQQWQGGAGAFGQLLQTLAQMQMQKQAQDFFAPKDYSVDDIQRKPTVVSTDLLGKPITAPSQLSPNYGQPVPTPVTLSQQPQSGTFNPAMDMDRILQAQVSVNPFLQSAGKNAMQNYLSRREISKPVFANAGDTPITYDDQSGKWNIGTQTPTTQAGTVWEMEKNPDGSVKQYNFGSSIQSRSVKKVNGKVVEEKYDSLGSTPSPNQMESSEKEFNEWRGTKDYRSVVEAIGRGSVSLSSTIAGRYSSPKVRQQVLADVLRVNPDYREYTYSNDKSFQSQYQPHGRIGQKIANLNTAIEHTGKAFDTIEKLGNNDAQIVNQLKNWFAQTFGTKRAEALNSFEAIRSALSGELGALFKGGNAAATDPEIDNISAIISSTQKPSALKEALKMYLSVGKDRIDQFAEPYNERFGENKDFLNSNPKKILQKMGLIGGTPTNQSGTIWDTP